MVDAAGRWAPVGAFVLLVVLGTATTDQSVGLALVGAAVAVLAALASGSLRGWPLLAGLVVAAAGVTMLAAGEASNLGWFGICVLAGWAALRSELPAALLLGAVLVGDFVVQWVAAADDGGWGTWIAGTIFTIVVCLMAHRQLELVERLRAAQAGLAERAATEERARIARELHDVIGHALTVSLIHVTSARLALREDPEEAAEALAEAERLGQQSLAEVRHAVGLLRDADPSARSPLPGAAQLDELVDGFRRTGTPLAWEVGGDPATLSATSGLTVYRILQEALTNVARHAPGAPTTARLSIDSRSAELVVDSAGPVHGPAEPGSGTGVAGMRERAEAIGGTLTAGPAELGWRVRAVVPT